MPWNSIFGGQLADIVSTQRMFLFISGYIEYPYSQNRLCCEPGECVGWEPIRIERLTPDGRWQTIVPDAGAFGGMARTMTVDLTGLLSGPACRFASDIEPRNLLRSGFFGT